MAKPRVGVIGIGHLGWHHARILSSFASVDFVGVFDKSTERMREAARELQLPVWHNLDELTKKLDAAVIAVPTQFHHEVASTLLAQGKSLLIEKPLAATKQQAQELVELAARRKVTLQVGHIERFNTALELLPELDDPPRFIQVRRCSPYSFRSTDIGVTLDLMVHDLDVIRSLLGEMPVHASGVSWSVFGGQEDVVAAQLQFPSGTLVHCLASRASENSRREMELWWPDRSVSIDFAMKKCSIREATPEFFQDQHLFRTPDLKTIRNLKQQLQTRYFRKEEEFAADEKDQLTRELEDFVSALRSGVPPRVTGADGLAAVEMAEMVCRAACERPMKIAA